MNAAFRIAALALTSLCAGTAFAAPAQAIQECATLSGNQQISRFGNQYVLVRDGDTYYRLQADRCDKLSLATSFELQAESQSGRICPRDTQIETNTGKCKATRAEVIDEATYLRYQRRR
ncbi:hypothetical protein [Lysobacter solisilvae (ex Woo and Kim 2020)]|uniref:Uncharacterized protein n=1 Tax=Agrilutibacter terrestris TaxID=2865112 RepID=A0A7H0FXG1_9GAMM|nr:hypothetical protein [Lysobacter terrestris]QNP40727.1 hypothetical protein H8B22_00195 [Lysobacter terrestris]